MGAQKRTDNAIGHELGVETTVEVEKARAGKIAEPKSIFIHRLTAKHVLIEPLRLFIGIPSRLRFVL